MALITNFLLRIVPRCDWESPQDRFAPSWSFGSLKRWRIEQELAVSWDWGKLLESASECIGGGKYRLVDGLLPKIERKKIPVIGYERSDHSKRRRKRLLAHSINGSVKLPLFCVLNAGAHGDHRIAGPILLSPFRSRAESTRRKARNGMKIDRLCGQDFFSARLCWQKICGISKEVQLKERGVRIKYLLTSLS